MKLRLQACFALTVATAFSLVHPGRGATITAVVAVLAKPNPPVGTTLIAAAANTGIAPDAPQYRFEIAASGGTFKIIKDYSEANIAEWTPIEEGLYQIRLT